MSSHTFHPNLPVFLHGYICHIFVTLQLCPKLEGASKSQIGGVESFTKVLHSVQWALSNFLKSRGALFYFLPQKISEQPSKLGSKQAGKLRTSKQAQARAGNKQELMVAGSSCLLMLAGSCRRGNWRRSLPKSSAPIFTIRHLDRSYPPPRQKIWQGLKNLVIQF